MVTIDRLEEQLIASKEIQLEKFESFNSSLNEKLAKFESTQTIAVDSYKDMFATSKDMYSVTLTGLCLIIALAGIFTFISLNVYKRREVQKLADDALNTAKNQLTPYTEALVANALDKVFVSEKLDTALEKVATDVEKRILTTLVDRAAFSATTSNATSNNTAQNLQSILQD